jgi:hypothetical protein
MEELMPTSQSDAIRELLIIIVGLIVRAIEKRKIKRKANAKSED